MTKQLTPNLETQKQSIIYALRNTYTEYKNAVIEALKWSWVDDDGNFAILEGCEIRDAKVKELEKELMRLKFKLDEIKEGEQ